MKRKGLVLLLCLICMTAFSACGQPDSIDISAYRDKEIVLSGAAKEEIKLTVGDLAEMECVTKKTHSTSDKIGEVRATGPLLDTILKPYGVKQEDFEKIEILASDGYEIKLIQDFLKENPIIVTFGIDGKPLDQESAPLRIIIPESDSAYWIRKVNQIKFY